jgi:hypothetical protein
VTTPNPPPPPPPPTWLDKLGGKFVTLGVIGGVLAPIVAWSSGYVKDIYTWKVSSDQAASQTSAMAERLTLLEKGEKERLAAVNQEALDTLNAANDLKNRIAEAQRLGQDVKDMQERLRHAETKLAELSTAICFITQECKQERRRK